jgi:hypothetical protein
MNVKITWRKTMRKTNFNANRLKRLSVFFAGFLMGIFMLYGCASRKPQLGVGMYRFNFKGDVYRIQSIFPVDEERPYNQLIGKNFVAVDYSQDRIIDRITVGSVSREEAQKIYSYGLDMATKENKLREQVSIVNFYVHEDADFYCMIRSLQPANAYPFNEFRIIDKRQETLEIMIIVDHKADGTLDDVLMGTVTLEEAQPRYSDVIKGGLKKRELIKVDNMILVKER